MVHYIRFLKSPVSNARHMVKALICVTTDLGDDFFPSDLKLRVVLMSENRAGESECQSQEAYWKAGMRALWIAVPMKFDEEAVGMRPKRLSIGPPEREGSSFDNLSLDDLPDIISCWSNVTLSIESHARSMLVERHFMIQQDHMLYVFEDAGESIARHIWDSGIALVAFLAELKDLSTNEPGPFVRDLVSSNRELKVLELGSGSGIVGIAFAQIFPQHRVVLTDLPEAMEILDWNVRMATVASKAKLSRSVLDWQEFSPFHTPRIVCDIVLISDCTYNSDSIPHLVSTLSALALVSPNIAVLIALKRRHVSEAVLYDLLDQAAFAKVYHTSIPLPDRGKAITADLEKVEIYEYRLQDKA